MVSQQSEFSRLEKILDGKIISSKQKTYHCSHIDYQCIIFSETAQTKQVMLPVVVALEWISALETGLININMTGREMRGIVAPRSDWAKQIHSFDTHLWAIVQAWHNSKY